MTGFLKRFERGLSRQNPTLHKQFREEVYGAKIFVCDDVFHIAENLITVLCERDEFPRNQLFMPAERIVIQFRDDRRMNNTSDVGKYLGHAPDDSTTEIGRFFIINGKTGVFSPTISLHCGYMVRRPDSEPECFYFNFGFANLKQLRTSVSRGRFFLPVVFSPQYRALISNLVMSYPQEMRESVIAESSEENVYMFGLAAMFLTIINSPRHFGQKERKLGNLISTNRAGSFPYRGCTEIYLKHTETGAITEKRGPILSGRKCLHFVRSFTRVRNGNLELVSPHWRGDGALGVKDSRYVVES